jgi:hypothetical protein
MLPLHRWVHRFFLIFFSQKLKDVTHLPYSEASFPPHTSGLVLLMSCIWSLYAFYLCFGLLARYNTVVFLMYMVSVYCEVETESLNVIQILCLRMLKRAQQTQCLCLMLRSNILWSSRCETRRTSTFSTRALWTRNKFRLTELINWQNASNPSVLSTCWTPRLTFRRKCFFLQVRFQRGPGLA